VNFRTSPTALACPALLAVALLVDTMYAVDIAIDSRAAFIHTASADPSLPAAPIALGSLGIAPGDRIELTTLGDFDNGPRGDIFKTSMGIFSASPLLLAPSALNRVVDALDAGVDFISAPTFFGGEPTDVPQDFVITSGAFPGGTICVIVPRGATHLFISAHDSLYGDNSDPDGDFAVRITLLDECVADLDGSGSVDGADLGPLLANWGPTTVIGAPGDLNCDGVVDGNDLGALLSAWGACE